MYQSNLIGKITGQPLPGEKDPSRRVRAWKQAAALVETEREKLQRRRQTGVHHRRPLRHHRAVFVLHSRRAKPRSNPSRSFIPWIRTTPQNQFYFWPEYNYRDQRKGQNAIFVTEAGPLPARTRLALEMAEAPAGESTRKIPPPSPCRRASRRNLNPSPTSANTTSKSATASSTACISGRATI